MNKEFKYDSIVIGNGILNLIDTAMNGVMKMRTIVRIQRSKRSNSTAHKIAVHLPSFLWPPEADDNHWLTAFDDDVTAWEEKSIV